MSDSKTEKIERMREILAEFAEVEALREKVQKEGRGRWVDHVVVDDRLKEYARLLVDLGDEVPEDLTLDKAFPVSPEVLARLES